MLTLLDDQAIILPGKIFNSLPVLKIDWKRKEENGHHFIKMPYNVTRPKIKSALDRGIHV